MALPSTQAHALHPVNVTAKVAKAPTSMTGSLEVTIPAFGGERSLVRGWAPRESLPVVGDDCLINYDERGDPWVVAWIGARSLGLVSALPTSPRDGQECYFQNTAMGEQGVAWHLHYRAASASTHKWEFVGGSDYSAYGNGEAEQTLASAAYVYQEVKGTPSVTVPLAGDYLMCCHVALVQDVGIGEIKQLNISIGPSAGLTGLVGVFTTSTRYASTTMFGKFGWGSATAGQVFKAWMAGNDVEAKRWSVQYLTMAMVPQRVG